MDLKDIEKAIVIIKHNLTIYKNKEDYINFLKEYHNILVYEQYLKLIKEELQKDLINSLITKR